MAEPDRPRIDAKDGDMGLSTLLLGLSLPRACEEGVVQNLEALAAHAATVRRALEARTAG